MMKRLILCFLMMILTSVTYAEDSGDITLTISESVFSLLVDEVVENGMLDFSNYSSTFIGLSGYSVKVSNPEIDFKPGNRVVLNADIYAKAKIQITFFGFDISEKVKGEFVGEFRVVNNDSGGFELVFDLVDINYLVFSSELAKLVDSFVDEESYFLSQIPEVNLGTQFLPNTDGYLDGKVYVTSSETDLDIGVGVTDLDAVDTLYLSSESEQLSSYRAESYLRAGGGFVVGSSGSTGFYAGSGIDLEPNFDVKQGAYFDVGIE